MTLLASAIWPGLVAALVLGAVVGAVCGLPRERIGFAIAGILAVALVALVALAVTSAVPGAGGLWVEAAAAMLAVYLAGCLLGGLGRRLTVKG